MPHDDVEMLDVSSKARLRPALEIEEVVETSLHIRSRYPQSAFNRKSQATARRQNSMRISATISSDVGYPSRPKPRHRTHWPMISQINHGRGNENGPRRNVPVHGWGSRDEVLPPKRHSRLLCLSVTLFRRFVPNTSNF